MTKPGKQATKGQKQILEENRVTISFYSKMSTGASILYMLIHFIFFWDTFTLFYWFVSSFLVSVHISSLACMKYMAKTAFGESGNLIDGGIDLNMENGFAEHLKDLIILTSLCQCAAGLSNYFLLLWFLAPARAFYLLWVNILGPWIFHPAEEAPNEEKKQRKMERKMKRREYLR